MFPLYMHDLFGYSAAMALATLIGVGFGFVLERAGFGRANVLVDQFFGVDNRVLKVMFTGIATTTAGLGLFHAVGILDLGAVSIPTTYLAPQVVGGLLLGVGFAISGYCPGTAVVAAGSGNRDGWYSIGGTMLGAVLFALAWPWLEGFYLSGDMGALTLPVLLGLPWGVVAAGVVAMAIGVFLLAEKGEAFFSRRAGQQAPASSPPDRNLVFGAMALVALVGLALPMIKGEPARAQVADRTPAAEPISPVGLADRVVTDPTGMWLVDLRDPAACAAERVPGAICLPEEDPDAAMIADLPATRSLVLYGQGDLGRLPDSVASFKGEVLTLTGGFQAFDRTLLTKPTPPANPSREAVAEYQHLAALHGQLTGSAAAAPPVVVKAVKIERTAKKGGGC